MSAEKKFSRKSPPERTRRMVETIFACKWSLTVLTLIDEDIRRPGAMVRAVEGLTPKVLNQCLVKLVEFDIVNKQSYPEIPPRVEYEITSFGQQFSRIFGLLDELGQALDESN